MQSTLTKSQRGKFLIAEDGTRTCAKCGRVAKRREKHTQRPGYVYYLCDFCAYARHRELHPTPEARKRPPRDEQEKRGPKGERIPRTRQGRKPYPHFAFLSSNWQACLNSWLETAFERTGSLSTYEHYRQVVQEFLSGIDKSPELATREEVETYLKKPGGQAGRVGNPVKAGSKNNRLSCLKSFYTYAANWPVLDGDGRPQPLLQRLPPTAGIRLLQREKPAYRTLDDQALTRFFSVIDRETIMGARDYALWLTYYVTCQRRQVLCDLKWADIQPAIFIENGVRRAGWQYSWLGKGRGRVLESAELPDICYSAIVRYLEMSGKLPIIQPDWPVFTTVQGHAGEMGYDPQRPIAAQTVWQLCKRLAARAGIPLETVCPHAFRHSGAQGRLLAGQSIFDISTHLHHRSLDMTAIYLKELVSPIDKAPAALAARFAAL